MQDPTNHWRPDWTDESQYPSPETTPKEWAWEFLRRNPDYQSDFEELTKDLPSLREQVNEYSEYKPQQDLIRGHFLQKYGVSYALNPAHSPKYLEFQRQNEIITRRIKDYEMIFGEVLVSIDLLKPIKPQLAKVETKLDRYRELFCEEYSEYAKEKRLRTGKYAKYLRVLDAKYANISTSDIAKILYPKVENTYPEYRGNDMIKSDFEAAEKLMKTDYFFIC